MWNIYCHTINSSPFDFIPESFSELPCTQNYHSTQIFIYTISAMFTTVYNFINTSKLSSLEYVEKLFIVQFIFIFSFFRIAIALIYDNKN